jgi:hypothetical protein
MRKTLVVLTTAVLLAGAALTGPALARDPIPLSVNQIIDQLAAHTARIKADLRLTPEQEKNWPGFESAMREIGKTNADRQVAAQADGTQQKGPIDVIEQLRMQARFLGERSVDRKKLADAAQPLFISLSEQQKRQFTENLLDLSRWPEAD